ncbi:uncharacterized protein LOC119667005 [Teleopsis dalmanni]|uniref:uncharacterized protein LOC119667005 n=1 Tax=Teleopsis dalmanni TaxID=139649 RepID=UPI0018CF2012|nr:uncharacterized protein LOC119667005 [Teleopsis dalmanni]
MDSFTGNADGESSVEFDELERPALFLTGTINKHSDTKSVFNISVPDLFEQPNDEEKNYEAKLINELNEWQKLSAKAYQQCQNAREKHSIIDRSILSPENQAELEKAPCLQKFIADSVEFREMADCYLNVCCEEILKMQSNALQYKEHHLNNVKLNKIAQMMKN